MLLSFFFLISIFLMHAGLQTSKVLSGAMMMGNAFGLPTAAIPASLIKKAEDALKKRGKGIEFQCVAEVAGAAVSGTSSEATDANGFRNGKPQQLDDTNQ